MSSQLLALRSGAARFDPNVDDHHHACAATRCGSVLDVYVDGADAARRRRLDGFTTESTSIVFRGTCAACAGAAPDDLASTPTIRPTTTNIKETTHG